MIGETIWQYGDVQRFGIDLALILLDRALVLLDDEDLILGLLLCDRVLLGKRLIAREIHLRLGQQTFVVRELAFVLLLQDLIGPRIDLRQEVALLDQLTFGESDVGELAVDLGLHGHRRERRHGAERVDDFADIAGCDGRGADRLQRVLRETSA